MTYYGIVRNGRIEIDAPGELPEGLRVRVEAVADDPAYHLGDDAVDHPSVPADFAAEHEHYAYGTPKRNTA